MADLNNYIKKSHIKAVEKFAAELEAWRKETGDDAATLYEDAYTSFSLSNPRVENGYLCYTQDGTEYKENMLRYDEEINDYWEEDGLDSIMDYLHFWRACLRRAKRYWSMDTEKLDAIQDGEIEDREDEEDE